MPSNEYLKQVTIGPPEPLNGKILLEEYRPEWPVLFQQERRRIRAALGREDAAVEHVGSTSVPGLCAKPILDLLLLVEDAADEAAYVPPLERAGYTLKIREPDWYQHRLLKGADPAVISTSFPWGARRRTACSASGTGCGPMMRTGTSMPPKSGVSRNRPGNMCRTTRTRNRRSSPGSSAASIRQPLRERRPADDVRQKEARDES